MPKKIRTAIVEDDLVAQLLLEYYCSNIPALQLDRKLDTVSDSIAYLNKEAPDLLFLDIELNDGLSWNILEKVSSTTEVIITTRNADYASFAREKYGVKRSLLKPIALADFLNVIQEVIGKKN